MFVLLSFCPFSGGSVSQLAAVGLSPAAHHLHVADREEAASPEKGCCIQNTLLTRLSHELEGP